MAQMPVAASTFPYLYSEGGLDTLKRLRAMGYENFELMIFPPHCWPSELSPDDRKAYAAWLDGEGARVTSFCYPLIDNNPNSPDKLMRDYTLDRYREAIDFAAELSCPYVCAIPGPAGGLIDPPVEWQRDWFVEGMKSLVDHAKGTGVKILLENVPFTAFPTAEDMKGLAQAIGPEVGINFDVCNSLFIKEDAAAAIRMLGNLIENVHLSDTPADAFKHDPLGTGIVDPAPSADALRDIGYDKLTVLEIITDANAKGVDPEADIRNSHAILAKSGWAPLGESA